ncbi:MAG: hypothetical protein K9I68_02430 [Bacteroidales bacterium]|nr:hypothetical protein [Bacteroidales bacterium]MCF8337170.1 hypothetical protein [Bacteroidales bacterium]
MRKIINGYFYDTERATAIATATNGYQKTDFQYMEETLYQSPSGQFFIAGEGGAKSSYRQRVGSNNWGGGEDIYLVSPQDAKEWLEDHQSIIDEDVPEIFKEWFPGYVKEG